jgi:hypothetical protein
VQSLVGVDLESELLLPHRVERLRRHHQASSNMGVSAAAARMRTREQALTRRRTLYLIVDEYFLSPRRNIT